MTTFAKVALAGPYGGYGSILIFLAVSMFVNDTDFNGSTLDAILILGGYTIIAGATSFLQIWFLPDLKEWYQTVIAASDEDEVLETKINAGEDDDEEVETISDTWFSGNDEEDAALHNENVWEGFKF